MGWRAYRHTLLQRLQGFSGALQLCGRHGPGGCRRIKAQVRQVLAQHAAVSPPSIIWAEHAWWRRNNEMLAWISVCFEHHGTEPGDLHGRDGLWHILAH